MPRFPDPDDDVEPIGFGDGAPVKREAPPLRIDKYDGHPDHDGPEPPPTRKKRKKKKPDLLERIEKAAEIEPPWWRIPLIMLGSGLALCLIPLIMLVVRASEDGAAAGVTAGALGAVLMFLVVVVQVCLMAGIMFGVGIVFGIDYGPIGRGFVKLAAVIALLDGITGGLGLALHAGCGVPGIIMTICVSAILAYALLQTQFELTSSETLVTVMGVMTAAVSLSAVVAYVVLAKLKKAAAAGA